MNFASPGESWSYQLRYYEALERSGLGWEHLGAYRRLVAQIAASHFAERLFGLRSLDFLVVSPTPGWVKKGPKFIDRSRITIRPCQDERISLTLVKKWKGQPHEAEMVKCHFEEAWQVLEPWLQSLQEQAEERKKGTE